MCCAHRLKKTAAIRIAIIACGSVKPIDINRLQDEIWLFWRRHRKMPTHLISMNYAWFQLKIIVSIGSRKYSDIPLVNSNVFDRFRWLSIFRWGGTRSQRNKVMVSRTANACIRRTMLFVCSTSLCFGVNVVKKSVELQCGSIHVSACTDHAVGPVLGCGTWPIYCFGSKRCD